MIRYPVSLQVRSAVTSTLPMNYRPVVLRSSNLNVLDVSVFNFIQTFLQQNTRGQYQYRAGTSFYSNNGNKTATMCTSTMNGNHNFGEANNGYQPNSTRTDSNSPAPRIPPLQPDAPFGQRTPYYRRHPVPSPHRPPFPRQQPWLPQNSKPYPPISWDYRRWEYAAGPFSPSHGRFKVLSYNVLADYLANDHWRRLYNHIPQHMIEWKWRKSRILFELGLWSADIMCLQEVDRYVDLEEDLRILGYGGILKMRTGNAADGCAIFWRSSRFKLLYEECIEYSKHSMRDNVAQICVLEFINQVSTSGAPKNPACSGSCRVVVCNVHILYNPQRGEIKLGQVRLLLERANVVSKIWNSAPIVLCGDFNCTPGSPLYDFISRQKLDMTEVDRNKVSGQSSAEIRPPRPYVKPLDASARTSVAVTDDEKQTGDSPADAEIHPPRTHEESLEASTCTSGVDTDHERQPGDNSSRIYLQRNASSEEVGRKYTPVCGSVTESSDEAGNLNTCSFNSLSPEPSDVEGSCDAAVFNAHDHDPSHISVAFSSMSVTDSVHADGDCRVLDAKSEKISNDFEASTSNEVLQNQTCEVVGEFSQAADAVIERSKYDPTKWTPMEAEIASGCTDCTFMEHSLKLWSTYTEVQGRIDSREPNGEPLVTSYNRRFLGTVDYIWRSEGLETLGVLAPIPKHLMRWTCGFPTKKWGSDHIALVSELAFTGGREET